MNQADGTKFVKFDYWCEKCKYRDLEESEDPCHGCLEQPVNFHTDQPINYISASTKKKTNK